MTEFFNHPFFIIVGGLTVTLWVFSAIWGAICWVLGITPILFRLGMSLWRRKIVIFSDDLDTFDTLQKAIAYTKIFKGKNIIHIKSNDIDNAKGKTIFLVDWNTFGDKIERVFTARKNGQTPIIIYASPGSIPPDKMTDIANRAHTAVVNFRGRLLNDVLTSLMTTSYGA